MMVPGETGGESTRLFVPCGTGGRDRHIGEHHNKTGTAHLLMGIIAVIIGYGTVHWS
jgi:hypothetical protein